MDSVTVSRIRQEEDLIKHADWAADLLKAYAQITPENIEFILQKEIGNVFVHVLEDAGVYKWTQSGHSGFIRFLEEVSKS